MPKNHQNLIKRLAMTLIGVLVCSFSVGIFNLAAFGVDPFQCFAQGSHQLFSGQFNYGTYYTLLSLIMLIVVFLWDKHYIGIATFMNLFLTGFIVDYSYNWLTGIFSNVNILQRIIMLLVALIIICLGSSLYYTADLGVSVYDALSLIMAKKKVRIFKYQPPF